MAKQTKDGDKKESKEPKKARELEREAKAIWKSSGCARESKAFARLREMKCFPEVHSLIVSGHPVAKIARYIQQTMGEYTDVAFDSLLSVIMRYRDSLPPGEILAVHDPAFVEKARQEMRDEMENIRALDRVVSIMELNSQMRAESVVLTGIPDRTLHQECESTARVIKMRHDVSMDIALYGKSRDLGKLQVNPAISEIHNQFGDVGVKIASDHELNSRFHSILVRLAQASSLPLAESIDILGSEVNGCDS